MRLLEFVHHEEICFARIDVRKLCIGPEEFFFFGIFELQILVLLDLVDEAKTLLLLQIRDLPQELFLQVFFTHLGQNPLQMFVGSVRNQKVQEFLIL